MELKKFNANQWRKFYKNYCENASEEELYTLFKGLEIIQDIFGKFYRDKFGSQKRFNDLREYWEIPTHELLKRLNKKVPY